MEYAIGVPAWVGPRGEVLGSIPPIMYVIAPVLMLLLGWEVYKALWVATFRARRLDKNIERYRVKQIWPMFSTRICFYSNDGKGYYYEDGNNERVEHAVAAFIQLTKRNERLIAEMNEKAHKKEEEDKKAAEEAAAQAQAKADKAIKDAAEQARLHQLARQELEERRVQQGSLAVADPDLRGAVSLAQRVSDK